MNRPMHPSRRTPNRSRRTPSSSRRLRLGAWRLGVVAAVIGMVAVLASAPANAEYAEIEGSGSTWAYGIIAPWIAKVAANGMQITFNQSGSSQGRKDFANYVTDFGDSDIPYQGIDPTTGQTDASSRPYAYLPVVAGGTAFTYHVTVAGHLVTNLRLSGKTIAKIFTNQITNWDDPEITKENGGHALPSETIKPVVRSDGSGATAQFTLWMDHQYPSIWRPYNGKAGLTSIYPRKGNQIAVAQDAGVMNTVSSSAGEGDIGYTEYSYPLEANYPVVYVENKAGYYVQPTQYNVAVALTKAQIDMRKTVNGKANPDYLIQQLNAVYNFDDKRTYPLSSYSYMIIPTSATDQRLTVAKRQTLADFLSYSLCNGQALAGPYGYSPLPLNLVKAAFGQIEKLGPDALGGAVKGVHIKDPSSNLATCGNPTFVKGNLAANHLADIAPMPLACQKATAVPCGDGTVPPGTTGPGGSTPSGSGPGGSTPTGTSPGGTSPGSTSPTGTGGTTPAGTTAPGATAPGATAPGSTDPNGAVTTAPGGTVATAANGGEPAAGTAVTTTSADLAAQRTSDNSVWGATAVVELLAIVLVPGLLAAWFRRRRARS